MPSYASRIEIHAEMKSDKFEMFEASSQDFCSRMGPCKRLGFINFCAVQHKFLSVFSATGLAALRRPAAVSKMPGRRPEAKLSLDVG